MGIPNLLNIASDTLSKFRATELRLGDGFRPYKFRVTFDMPQELQTLQKKMNDLQYFMKSAHLPNQTMEFTDIGILGHNVSYPTGINTSNEIDITLYVDDAHLARNYFDYWMHYIDKMVNVDGKNGEQTPTNALDLGSKAKEAISNAISGGLNKLFGGKGKGVPPAMVWGKMKIKALDMVGIRRQVYILHNVYPYRINQVTLDTSDINTIASVTVGFKYTHYERKLVGIGENVNDMLTEKTTGLF